MTIEDAVNVKLDNKLHVFICAFVKKFNTIIKRYFAINNVVVFKEFIICKSISVRLLY